MALDGLVGVWGVELEQVLREVKGLDIDRALRGIPFEEVGAHLPSRHCRKISNE